VQEFQPVEKWLSGHTVTPLIDLGKIDRVPVSFVVSQSDGICPVEQAEWYYNMIKSPDKYIRFERGGHGIFAYKLT